MQFIETGLPGAFIVKSEPNTDSRGIFARTFCAREFKSHGLMDIFVQCSISQNHTRGTLRGLHYQLPPFCEVKLVRCTVGAIHDVIVDLRLGSRTFLQHCSVELTAENRWALYVPEMFAHGFQTLTDKTEVFYQISQFYVPESSTGLRFNDPKLSIQWPVSVSSISEKDKTWPLLDD